MADCIAVAPNLGRAFSWPGREFATLAKVGQADLPGAAYRFFDRVGGVKTLLGGFRNEAH